MLKKIFISALIISLLLSIIPYLIPTHNFPTIWEYRKFFPESKFIQINGIWLHYRTFEPKQSYQGSICLIHGFSGSTFSWRKNTKALQDEGYQVLCVDLPAFGFSDRNTHNWNESNQKRIQTIWQLLELINPKAQWHLMGHSMGASYVWNVALYKPDRVGKIICVDGLPSRFKNFRRAALSLLLKYPPAKRWLQIIAENFLYTETQFHKLLEGAYAQKPDSQAVAGYLTPFRIKGTTEAIVSTFEHTPTDTLTKNLNYQDLPILLIWGEKDAWIPKSIAEKFVALNPSVQMQTIPQAGHCPMETHPEIFNQLVITFLKK